MSTVGQNLAEIRDIDANNLPNLQFFWAKERKIAAINSKAIAICLGLTSRELQSSDEDDRLQLFSCSKITGANAIAALKPQFKLNGSQFAAKRPQLSFVQVKKATVVLIDRCLS